MLLLMLPILHMNNAEIDNRHLRKSQALYSMQSEYIQAVTLEKQSSWYRELCCNTVHVLTVSG